MFSQAKTCIASVGVSEAFLWAVFRVSDYFLALNVMWVGAMCCAVCV